jgi:hypothetical protein
MTEQLQPLGVNQERWLAALESGATGTEVRHGH